MTIDGRCRLSSTCSNSTVPSWNVKTRESQEVCLIQIDSIHKMTSLAFCILHCWKRPCDVCRSHRQYNKVAFDIGVIWSCIACPWRVWYNSNFYSSVFLELWRNVQCLLHLQNYNFYRCNKVYRSSLRPRSGSTPHSNCQTDRFNLLWSYTQNKYF